MCHVLMQDFSEELCNYRPGSMDKDVPLDEVPYEADVALFGAPLLVLAPGAAGKIQAEAVVNARAAKATANANPIEMPATDQPEEVVCIVADEPTGPAEVLATGPLPFACLACGKPILDGEEFHEDVDGNGGRIHATEECEVAFENLEADKCARCGEPLLPIEGKFSGEVIEIDGGFIHKECQ